MPPTGPRVPPRGSRELRPPGEERPAQRISQAQKQVDEVLALEKQAGGLVRRNDLRGALQMYDECKVEVADILEGLPKDDPCYVKLQECQKSIEEKIEKCKSFIPFEYFLRAPQ
eukprot:TRINITY_DN114192_c0_g1_i1.p1 TRINITY_DN114192_c0_g1~~TRINITY_DN114192_c0_g1_i1.p1  ORF type:complete len:130 (+),score=35.17 TRINITY_DN114192_c0_g1_i1:49-390(+)